MKINKMNWMLMASIVLLPLASCKTMSGVLGKNKAETVSPDVKKESVLPNDREHIVPPVSDVYTSEQLAKGIVKGDWAIETVFGKSAVGETAPFLKFAPDQKMVYGNNGCNVINASYDYNPADSTISFTNMASTMKACHLEGITDYDINQALDQTRFYSWKLSGDDFYITFYNEARKPVMEMMHRNFQFLNGTWLVKEIDGQAVDVPDMKLVIDVNEGKLHGNTGCNIINGSLETDMDAANTISFQAIGKTRMACPLPNFETQLIVALEQACQAKPLIEGRAALLDQQGKTVLLLERTNDKLSD